MRLPDEGQGRPSHESTLLLSLGSIGKKSWRHCSFPASNTHSRPTGRVLDEALRTIGDRFVEAVGAIRMTSHVQVVSDKCPLVEDQADDAYELRAGSHGVYGRTTAIIPEYSARMVEARCLIDKEWVLQTHRAMGLAVVGRVRKPLPLTNDGEADW
eukprot:scaffold132923_cov37-Tisochrysis_lutea.AAC.3